MPEETNKTINFEELLDKLKYKEEKTNEVTLGRYPKRTILDYTTYFHYLGKKEDDLTYRIGAFKTKTHPSRTEITNINERKTAINELQFFLVNKLIAEETKKTPASDKEKMKELKEKEQKLSSWRRECWRMEKGLDNNFSDISYLDFYSNEKMHELIDRIFKEKSEYEEKLKRKEMRHEKFENDVKKVKTSFKNAIKSIKNGLSINNKNDRDNTLQ